ncbi:MAG: cytochrome c [Casimicrobiaceae bacterium]
MNLYRWLFVVALIAGVAAVGGGSTANAQAATPPATTQIDQGRYLVRIGDCAGCHTAKDGQALAGGKPLETGFGAIYAPNITPDRDTGIGNWSSDAFYRALHTGHDDEGKHLYPAFPYPWFTKVTRSDVDTIKAYLDTIAPVRRQNKPPQLDWWMRWRGSLVGWNLLNFDEGEFRPDAAKSAQWNRGAYLVEGLGHCGDCHTPKGYFGGAKSAAALAGGYTKGGHDQGWFAPTLTGEPRAGLGGWSIADIVTYLKTGANKRTASAGPMSEVITNSTSHLSNDDLEAIAVYLKSLSPRPAESKVEPIGRQMLERGQGLFTDQCAACHMPDGGGIPGFFPALMGSSAIQAREPATVVRIVLAGAREPARPGQYVYIAMPAFDQKLNDDEIAAVVSYVRNAWGNRASPIDAVAVAKQRKALAVATAVTTQ